MEETRNWARVELSLIRAYIKGCLDDAAKRRFEDRMRVDAQLRQDVYIFRLLIEVLHQI